MTRPLPCQRHRFDIPDHVAYLNCAYMSPLAKAVAAAGTRGLVGKAQPWTVTPADFFAESGAVRRLFAGLIHATADDIALIPSVSYGMAQAAANIPLTRGQRVLIPAEEFPSNVYPWQTADDVYVSVRGRALRVTPHLYTTDEDVERFFRALRRALR